MIYPNARHVLTNFDDPSKYVFGLDGLRAIAVSLVFLGHYHPAFPGPAFGVQMFFVVSGFIITRTLLSEYQISATIKINRFYLRRFLRLSPVLLVSTAVILLAWTAVGRSFEPMAAVSSVLYFSNYWQAYANSDIYMMPLWSLAIEEHFYLLFPTLLLLSLPRFRRAVWPFLILSFVVLLWRVTLWQWGASAWLIYLRTDTRIDALLFGVVLAMLPTTKISDRLRGIATVGLAILVGSFVFRDPEFRSTLLYTLQAIGCSGIMAYLLFSADTLATAGRRVLESAAPKLLGKMSYSIYLWHLPTLKILEQVTGDSLTVTLIAAVLTFGLSWATYSLIEIPMLSIRHRFGSHAS
jgi:peptidoglycan/LPS O-acetylase OafA/YrhL